MRQFTKLLAFLILDRFEFPRPRKARDASRLFLFTTWVWLYGVGGGATRLAFEGVLVPIRAVGLDSCVSHISTPHCGHGAYAISSG